MNDTAGKIFRNRLAVAGAGGFLAFILFWLAGGWNFFGALLMGLVLFALFYVLIGMIGAGGGASGSAPFSASSGAGHHSASTGGSTVPPSVGGGGAAAGGGAPAATSPAATGTPVGEGADTSSERSEDAAAAKAATRSGKGTTSGPAASADDDADPGVKPETLDAPRDGSADDLKRIKGVGPKLEELCNKLGFWHFDQIANWSDEEVAWVDRHLEGFKGRVRRDDWVTQARQLAGGGDTDFSRRVDKGGMY
ncbi:hypothetical protein MWU52_15585 [Jannaschia sp. S6380]|uniref:hypothetical protein n=1 Tax=Jannaschia sp. S6380 TaxID=2926408 RepID=UPI001FF17611|nr:hypothetical protein [Jannaschia sp. S6380]MCK0168977.1 hypothetical protein [Jannaschia sp. S6380]